MGFVLTYTVFRSNDTISPRVFERFKINIFQAIVVNYCIAFITGIIANNFFGKKIIILYETLVNKLPFVKTIYKGIKQVSDTLLSNSGNAFSKAVLIEFPSEGTYTFAFVTGEPEEKLAKYLKGKYVNVYVPTTPNPTSGFFVIIPKKDY